MASKSPSGICEQWDSPEVAKSTLIYRIGEPDSVDFVCEFSKYS
jgi:hypothetical protein